MTFSESYGLATFAADGVAEAVGLVVGDRIFPLSGLVAAADPLRGASVLALLDRWAEVLPRLDELAATAPRSGTSSLSVEEVRFLPPVNLPRQIFCTGANYRKHVVDLTLDMNVGPPGLEGPELRKWAENMMDERAARGEPYVFTKPVSAVAGANDPLVLPANTAKPDWEIELGVVIGEGGYRIPRERALEHVAGYAIVNDISARDLIPRKDYAMLGTDWLRAKGQPGFLPFGPYVVPARFVPDPHALGLKLSVNGQVMQDESSADMLFNIARQIEYISEYSRLYPGDLICTGSPAGNGTHYNRYLQPGDEMVAEIEGLGRQRVRCLAPGQATTEGLR